MSLHSLGISASDERVYRFLLRNNGIDIGAAADALALDTAALQSTVDRLGKLGLVTVDEAQHLIANDPEVAVERLIADRLAEVNGQMRHIADARSLLPSLVREQSERKPVELIERIEGGAAAQERIASVSVNSRECLSMKAKTVVSPELHERTMRLLAQGMAYRTVVSRSALDTPEKLAFRLDFHRAGDWHRVIDEPLQNMLIFDRRVAFVQLEPGNGQAGALMIRQPGVVATLLDLFERTWNRAADLEPSELTEIERRVLDLLIRVDKDEVAARELGVSLRTFRRHVAALMSRLGATNRFQTAYLARDRGWI